MAGLTKVVWDYETFWADNYSLSQKSMTTSLYIRDPRFKVHGVGIKIEDKPPSWVTGKDVQRLVDKMPWDRIALIGHNLKFDASILNWKYGKRPALLIDTKSMSRALFGNALGSFSLDSISQALLDRNKGKELALTKNIRDLSPEIEGYLAAYCITDCELTYECCKIMWPYFPKNELLVSDWCTRMFTEPMLRLDKERLLAFKESVLQKKQELLASLEFKYSKDVFTSNPKFAQVLMDLGIEPPTKISPTTGKETYAFAKTDEDLLELQESDILEVALVVQARLGIKTSIMETRAQSYANHADGGDWPVDIEYCGAKQTHRFSGASGGGGNPQNMGRDKEEIKSASGGTMLPAVKSELRRCILAPEGHVILAGDSTGIELRVAMMLTQSEEALDIIRKGGDLYCWFASKLFGRPITKADKTERFLGKEACLSLQYQSGAEKFRKTAGLKGVRIKLEESKEIVSFYRKTLYKVPQFWRICSEVILAMYRGDKLAIPPANIIHTGIDLFFINQFNKQVPALFLPGGLTLRYPGLRKDSNEQWVYKTRTFRAEHETKLYGGKLMENMCQALARVVIAEQGVRLRKFMPIVMQVHDELISVVPEADAEQYKAIMLREMSTPPAWWPDLPIAAEVKYHKIYGEAK